MSEQHKCRQGCLPCASAEGFKGGEAQSAPLRKWELEIICYKIACGGELD